MNTQLPAHTNSAEDQAFIDAVIESHKIENTKFQPKLHALHALVIAMSDVDFRFLDIHEGALAEAFFEAVKEHADDPNADCLQHMGFFSYALAETARNQTELQLVQRFCSTMMNRIVEFHLSENGIHIDDDTAPVITLEQFRALRREATAQDLAEWGYDDCEKTYRYDIGKEFAFIRKTDRGFDCDLAGIHATLERAEEKLHAFFVSEYA